MLRIWRCYGIVSGSKYLGEVEAETEEEAVEKAGELGSCGVSLCHQCSDECEDAEITEVVAEPGEPVKPKLRFKKKEK